MPVPVAVGGPGNSLGPAAFGLPTWWIGAPNSIATFGDVVSVSPAPIGAPTTVDVTLAIPDAAFFAGFPADDVWRGAYSLVGPLNVKNSGAPPGDAHCYFVGEDDTSITLATPTKTTLGTPHTYEFLCSAPSGGTGTLTLSWMVDGVSQSATGGTPLVLTLLPGTHTIALLAVDALGRCAYQVIRWNELNIPPVADFTFTVDELHVELDASASDDPDDFPGAGTPPVPGALTYKWTFGDGQNATLAIASASHDYANAGSIEVTLIVNDGALDSLPVTKSLTVDDGRNAACFDHAGTLYSALKDPDSPADLRIYRFLSFASGGATREPLSVIPNAKNPSLHSNGHGDVCLACADRASGDVNEYISHDRGASFLPV